MMQLVALWYDVVLHNFRERQTLNFYTHKLGSQQKPHLNIQLIWNNCNEGILIFPSRYNQNRFTVACFYDILGSGLFGVLNCSSRCTNTIWGNWLIYRKLVFLLEGEDEVKLPPSFHCVCPSPVFYSRNAFSSVESIWYLSSLWCLHLHSLHLCFSRNRWEVTCRLSNKLQ